jgi:hypothetical protein
MKKALCKENNEIKYINDFEVIDNIKIYYMTDNTSYAEHQVIVTDLTLEELKDYYSNQIEDSVRNIMKTFNSKFKDNFEILLSNIRSQREYQKLNFFEKVIFKLRECIRTTSINT